MVVSQEELAKRRDLRDEIIFTIDPKTARDLDDALSINPCDDVDGGGKPGWEVAIFPRFGLFFSYIVFMLFTIFRLVYT